MVTYKTLLLIIFSSGLYGRNTSERGAILFCLSVLWLCPRLLTILPLANKSNKLTAEMQTVFCDYSNAKKIILTSEI